MCLYPNASWNNDRPSLTWYDYGIYNLRDQYGTKRIFNNQHSGAVARTCRELDGKRCGDALVEGHYIDIDFMPINSIQVAAR